MLLTQSLARPGLLDTLLEGSPAQTRQAHARRMIGPRPPIMRSDIPQRRQGQTPAQVGEQLTDIGFNIMNSLGIQPFGPTSPEAYHTLDRGPGSGGAPRFATVTLGGGEAPLFPGGRRLLQNLLPKQKLLSKRVMSAEPIPSVKVVEAKLLDEANPADHMALSKASRAVDIKRPLVDARQNEEALKETIPALRKAVRKADYLGFDTFAEVLHAIRSEPYWFELWDVNDIPGTVGYDPELLRLGTTYKDLVENQKVIEEAGLAEQVYTRPSDWDIIKDRFQQYSAARDAAREQKTKIKDQ